MSDTQDTLIERLNKLAQIFAEVGSEEDDYAARLVREAATALADRDAKIAELEREIRACCEARDNAGIFPASPSEAIVMLTEERDALEAQVAELTQKLERATEAVEFVARWVWRTDPPNASGRLADSDRLSCIKHHPVIKKAAAPHIELAEHEARALNSGASQNG